ncbi:MAG: hypothetical protein JW751_03090 [Polyangiaceae bacterium]|nr:hypothetical protein [Polyangiaceae bacterium]
MRRFPLFSAERTRPLAGVGIVALVALPSLLGCQARREAAEHHLRALEDELDLLRGANDRLEARIGALELASRRAGTTPAANPTRAERTERPPLDVLKLEPSLDGPTETPGSAAAGTKTAPSKPDPTAEEGPPRLLIHGTGDRLEANEPGPTSLLSPTRPEVSAERGILRQNMRRSSWLGGTSRERPSDARRA